MPSTLTVARRALSKLGDRGRTTRIPDEVRSVILAYVREARRAGTSWKTVSDELGLSSTVIQRWNKTMSRPVKLQPVVVSDRPLRASASLVLVTAAGERLEGLGVDDAARMLRALR